MSKLELNLVMTKIKGATQESPIAVFKCDEPNKLNAVFASTVETQRQIRKKNPDLIGVYDNTSNLDEVYAELRKHIRKF